MAGAGGLQQRLLGLGVKSLDNVLESSEDLQTWMQKIQEQHPLFDLSARFLYSDEQSLQWIISMKDKDIIKQSIENFHRI